MAYKFQRGEAILSGSIELDGPSAELKVSNQAGELQVELAQAGTISGSANLSIGGTGVSMEHLGNISTIVAADDFIMLYDADLDSGVGQMKKNSFSSVMTAVAGGALGVASSQLKVNVDDSTIEVNGSDNLQVKDAGITFAKMQDVAGNSLLVRNAATNGDLSELEVTDTKIMIGNGAGFTAAALSGDVTMANDGTVSIGSNVIDGGAGGGMLNGAIVSDQTEMTDPIEGTDTFLFSDGTSVKKLSVDILGKELLGLADQAPVTGSTDFLLFLDSSDNSVTKKTDIEQFLDTIAGPGLSVGAVGSANEGKLVADGASAPSLVIDGAYTMAEGYNYYTGSASKTVVLPASPAVGDVYYIKAGALGAGNSIKITGSNPAHLIDGLQFHNLESQFGAIGFVYLAAGNFGIV